MNETPELVAARATPDKYKFQNVKDGRGRVVSGLWVRNDRYYGFMRVPGKGSRRVPLYTEDQTPVATVKEAQAAYRPLLTGKENGEAPQSRRAKPFNEYIKHYITCTEELDKKTMLTINKERFALNGWVKTLGNMTLVQISRADINKHLMARKQEGCSNRTLNLDVIALGNCLKFAKEEGWIKTVVTEGIKPLDHVAPKRELLAVENIEAFCAEVLRRDESGDLAYANGQQLHDYIRFMQYCGARRESAIHVRWSDIDFSSRRVTLRKTKYSKTIVVTFNPKLEALLTEMSLRRLEPDDKEAWLFPNPFNTNDRANFRKTLDKVRAKTNIVLQYHDLRHFFISYCVMSGIDFMTIAQWVGHSDGGVLIGRVYGHINDAHLQRKAASVSFGEGPRTAPDFTTMTVAELIRLVPGAFQIPGVVSAAQPAAQNRQEAVAGGGIEPPTQGFSVPQI